MTDRRSYTEYLGRKRAEYGERFSDSNLAPQFVRYFESGARVRIRTPWGDEMTGTIGVTTGWVPTFLLMRRSSDHGSSWLLDADYAVVAVQRGRKYEAVTA